VSIIPLHSVALVAHRSLGKPSSLRQWGYKNRDESKETQTDRETKKDEMDRQSARNAFVCWTEPE
jgi:hypothetical protein